MYRTVSVLHVQYFIDLLNEMNYFQIGKIRITSKSFYIY